jgi:aspartate kinase
MRENWSISRGSTVEAALIVSDAIEISSFQQVQVAARQPRRYVYAPFRAGAGHYSPHRPVLIVLLLPGKAMARLVMKFGGTSVADMDRIRNVARHVKREVDAGHDVAVVVSAMSGKTNELVAWCRDASPLHDAREYDAVVSSGEQVTAGLLAIALQNIGVNARSWQGWQLPMITSDAHGSARILDLNGEELIQRFRERKEVAVIAGFQGIHKETGRITTLGRGGSDTSAVAVAAAIGAERCDIYTDVDGVYTTDPRVVPQAQRMEKIAFEEMLELASLGAKVMQVRSVELGMVRNVRIFVRSSFEKPEDIDPHAPPRGTLICDESEIMEQQVVTGIAFSKDEAQISIRRVQDKPGVAAAIFGPLASTNINVDMIVQNVSADGSTTDLTFTVPSADYERARATIEKAKSAIGFERIDGATDVAKVSVIGIGMRSHAGVASRAFRALAEHKINIRAITTSEIKFSVLIDASQTELAVRTLHTLYGLDKA